MRIILEFDDFHPDQSVNCLDYAEYLIQRYPRIVINFFTIPKYIGHELYKSKYWCSSVAEHIKNKNICLGVHGLLHTQEEFAQKTYQSAYAALQAADNIFKTSELEYTKVFKGPHWGICGPAMEALTYCKYKYIYSHVKHKNITDRYLDQIKVVHYNWNLKDTFGVYEHSLSGDICVAHGHTGNVCGNGIGESMSRIVSGIDQLMTTDDFQFLRIDQYES